MKKPKKKRQVRLPLAKALSRLEAMSNRVYAEVKLALANEAMLESGNAIVVNGLSRKDFPGSYCYNIVAQSVTLFLALQLAKLFEVPQPRSNETSASRQNRSDVASVPLLVRLLRQPRCKRALIERAPTWMPGSPSLGKRWAADCEGAIARALCAYARLSRTRAGRRAMQTLKGFRDKQLAHILLEESGGQGPRYKDLFFLADVARDVIEATHLALTGDNLCLDEQEEIWVAEGRAFWEPALRAVGSADQ